MAGKKPGSSRAARAGEVEWIGTQVASPVLVGSGADASRPELTLWVEAPSGLVLAVDLVEPGDSRPRFAASLEKLLTRRPHREAASRPDRIRVEDEGLAEQLRGVTDIPVIVAPTPELRGFLASLGEHLGGAAHDEPESFLEGGTIPEEAMADLFATAAELWKAAPWRHVLEGDLIRVDSPEAGLDGAVVCVIGQAQQSRAMLLFASLADFESFRLAAEKASRRPSARPDLAASWLSLSFEPRASLPPAMVAEVKRYGWKVAGASAYPVVARHGRDGAFLPASEKDVLRLCDVAGALGPFVDENREVFAEDSEQGASTVYDDDDGFQIRLTFPYEAGDEAQERAPVPRPLSLVPPVASSKPAASRNAPCPCGSGEKYKKCCLPADEARAAASDPARLHAMDARLVPQLYRFAEKRLGMDRLDLAGDLFADPHHALQLVGPWSLYARQVRGKTVAQRFVEEHGKSLSPAEQAWLAAQGDAHLSVWEVTQVERGVGFVARDLLTGERKTVHEVTGSRTLNVRDTLLARVASVNELSVMAGAHPNVLPPLAAAAVVDAVRRKLRKKTDVARERLRDEKVSRVMVQAWEDIVAEEAERAARPPVLHNTDGDELLGTTDHFAVAAGARADVAARLAALADIESEAGGVFVLLRRGQGKLLDNTVIGRLVVEGDRLQAESNSVRRADALRKLLDDTCPGLLRFRLRTHADLMSSARPPAGTASPAAPPPEIAAALREMQERYLASWIDQPVPMLDGKTPRQASKSKAGRAAVELILREMEHQQARLPDLPPIDVVGVRRELGLDR